MNIKEYSSSSKEEKERRHALSTLETMKRELDRAGVTNNGIEHDALTQANYISFYDPDGIAWELYVSARQ